MSLYRIDQIDEDRQAFQIDRTTFAATGILERKHLQSMLKSQIEMIAPDTLVVAEEFGEWEDSQRRIDLLGIDKEANLVVIEIKRTEDGGHMELQALRYAAMISTLTFGRCVAIYDDFLGANESELDAEQSLLEFLNWDEPDEDMFGQQVKIILASADFSKELCTCVMWLNDFGLDVRCVRMLPYMHRDSEVLLDIQTVIPLAETEDYQVRIREKKKEQEAHGSSRDYTKYNVTVAGTSFQRLNKRRMMFHVITEILKQGKSPEDINDIIPVKRSNLFESFDGQFDSTGFVERLSAEKNEDRATRYFTRDDELFHFADKTYALTNQWGGQGFKPALDALTIKLPEFNIKCDPVER